MTEDLDEHKKAVTVALTQLKIQDFSEEDKAEDLEQRLADYLNDLVATNFNKLIEILYRIDISQEKAVAALANASTDETSGEILAKLVIARQKEKIHFRKLYSK